jgi:hypothetical protein
MIQTGTMFATASSVELGLDSSALIRRQDWCQPLARSLEIRGQLFHWMFGRSIARQQIPDGVRQLQQSR